MGINHHNRTGIGIGIGIGSIGRHSLCLCLSTTPVRLPSVCLCLCLCLCSHRRQCLSLLGSVTSIYPGPVRLLPEDNSSSIGVFVRGRGEGWNRFVPSPSLCVGPVGVPCPVVSVLTVNGDKQGLKVQGIGCFSFSRQCRYERMLCSGIKSASVNKGPGLTSLVRRGGDWLFGTRALVTRLLGPVNDGTTDRRTPRLVDNKFLGRQGL